MGNVAQGAALGLVAGGGRGVVLNQKIQVPPLCHFCGTPQGTQKKTLTKMIDIGGLPGFDFSGIPKDSAGRARADLEVGLCETCAGLRSVHLLVLTDYGKRAGRWSVSLQVPNRSVAYAYYQANPGTSVSYVGLLTDAKPQELWGISPDGGRRVYAGRLGPKWVVVDGASQSRPYDGIFGPPGFTFSQDGMRLAYTCLDDDACVVVSDDTENGRFEEVFPKTLLFSPDGRRFAYAARRVDRCFAVLDGTPLGGHDDIAKGSNTFTPNGAYFAYLARDADEWKIWLDEASGKGYPDLGPHIAFSQDSRHVAYVAKLADGKWVAVRDGVEGPPHQAVTSSTLTFSPDGTRLAFVAGVPDRWRVGGTKPILYLDEKQVGPVAFDGGKIVFSPDGSSVTYQPRE